jgi:hypothetical protein
MNYILYPFLVIINIFGTVLTFPLALLIVLFAKDEMGWVNNATAQAVEPRLPKWLHWFQTWDNSLDGDATFQASNPPNYLSKIKWLIRNPLPSFLLRTLTAPYNATYKGNPTIKDNDNAKAGWLLVHANGLFQFAFIAPIGFSRCLYVNLGWNIRALVDDNVQPKPDPYQATYVFSPRISGFK